jgi:hypothetical protein
MALIAFICVLRAAFVVSHNARSVDRYFGSSDAGGINVQKLCVSYICITIISLVKVLIFERVLVGRYYEYLKHNSVYFKGVIYNQRANKKVLIDCYHSCAILKKIKNLLKIHINLQNQIILLTKSN